MRKVAASMLLLCALASCASAGGKGEAIDQKKLPPEVKPQNSQAPSANWVTVSDGQFVEVSGKIRVVGNEPFSDLVLMDSEENNWFIGEDSLKIVDRYEQQTVRVAGKVVLKKLTLANGTALPDRRILTELTLIQ